MTCKSTRQREVDVLAQNGADTDLRLDPIRAFLRRCAAEGIEHMRRKAVLWDAVDARKQREADAWRAAAEAAGVPEAAAAGIYAATLADAEAALASNESLASVEREIAKDIKRTFPWMESYATRESATRNVLLAYGHRNPAVGYCQSLNYICGALLMSPLPEEDAFFSLCTIVEDLLPGDYYTHDLLGAQIDQLVFAELMRQDLPELTERLAELECPMSLFSLQWFMCLFAKDLPLALTLRVWDVMFVYGDHALFAFALALLQVADVRKPAGRNLIACWPQSDCLLAAI